MIVHELWYSPSNTKLLFSPQFNHSLLLCLLVLYSPSDSYFLVEGNALKVFDELLTSSLMYQLQA